jgi:hypothetical protein
MSAQTISDLRIARNSDERLSSGIDWRQMAQDAWNSPGCREAAADYHRARGQRKSVVEVEPERLKHLRRLLNDSVSLEAAWSELNQRRRDGAPAATVEALVFGLRDGIKALPTNRDRLCRLSEMSADQLRSVCERLQRFKPNIAPAWSPEEVRALVDIWSRINADR